MHIVADVRTTPFTNASTRDEVGIAYELLEKTGLPVHLHAHGTNIEGSYDVIADAVRTIHEFLHARGVDRVVTTLSVSSRTDSEDSIERRLHAIRNES